MGDLDALGIEHSFRQIPRPAVKTWEEITRQKPFQVVNAITRHPDKTIVFLDVDCRVLGPLDKLAAIPGDVGLHIRTKFRRRGGIRWGVRSGTLVFKPTKKALFFAHHWQEAARHAPWGSEDQQCLAVAMGRVPGCTFTSLSVRYCAVEADRCINPIIAHDSASKGIRKVKGWQKTLRWLWR